MSGHNPYNSPYRRDEENEQRLPTPNSNVLNNGAGAMPSPPPHQRAPEDDPYAPQENVYHRQDTPQFARPPTADQHGVRFSEQPGFPENVHAYEAPPQIPQYDPNYQQQYGEWGRYDDLNHNRQDWQNDPYAPYRHQTNVYPYENETEQMPAPDYPVNEAPDSYLLQPYGQVQFPNSQPSTPGRAYDDSYVEGSEFETFQPFPISGDHYQLNTWEEVDYDDDDHEHPGNFPIVAPQHDDDAASFAEQDENPYTHDQTLIPPPGEGMQPRRAKTMRKVRLYRGNLVLDCPVSKRMLDQLKEPRQEREFTHMRYSAATCDPAYFVQNNFTLRQTCYQQPRETELFICITIYNEDDVLLGRTLQGVFANIRHLTSRTRSKTWGKDAWKKVVVCVVADGRAKIHPRSLALMAALGIYQDGFAKQQVNDRDVEAHIFEYTTMIGVNARSSVKLTTEKALPIQMIFCLKERNKKKINSHRWFFQAFSPILDPKVCVLIDAGTMPGHDSIYHLWKTFDMHPNVGGACGEIKTSLGTGFRKLLNPLVAAQNFEYKMSNILDKPMESAFGFITVLPGAFSAYRYRAVLNEPLDKYFKGEVMDSKSGIFTANMYLAEDRILCFELVAKRGKNWLLKYVKSSSAETDVPERVAELVMQRRRWLNGSFFAAIYAQAHLFNIWKSGHSLGRKFMLQLEFVYQLVAMLFSWFSIGNFFLVFRILTGSLSDKSLGFAPGNVLSVILLWVYCGCIVTIFVLSFGNRPMGTEIFYVIVVAFFAFLMAYLMFAAIYISVKSVQYAICMNDGFSVSLMFGNRTFRDLVVSMLSTYALYIISSTIFFEPWHLATSFLQYVLISPAYINVLNVYAFCNIHDVTWGTKGDTKPDKDLGVAKADDAGKLEVDIPTHVQDIDNAYSDQIAKLSAPPEAVDKTPSQEDRTQDYYALFRSTVVLTWMFTNFAIIAVVLNTAGLSGLGSNSDDDKDKDNNSDSNANPANSGQSRRDLDGGLFKRKSAKECGNLGGGSGIRTQIYLSVVLWAVASLAAFRFIGAMWYLTARLFGR